MHFFFCSKCFTFCWDKLDYPGSIVYVSCFVYFYLQKSFSTKTYFLITKINLTSWVPLYTCLFWILLSKTCFFDVEFFWPKPSWSIFCRKYFQPNIFLAIKCFSQVVFDQKMCFPKNFFTKNGFNQIFLSWDDQWLLLWSLAHSYMTWHPAVLDILLNESDSLICRRLINLGEGELVPLRRHHSFWDFCLLKYW